MSGTRPKDIVRLARAKEECSFKPIFLLFLFALAPSSQLSALNVGLLLPKRDLSQSALASSVDTRVLEEEGRTIAGVSVMQQKMHCPLFNRLFLCV